MQITSGVFLIFSLGFVIGMRLAPTGNIRKALIAAANVAFVISLAPSATALAPLLAFIALGFAAIAASANRQHVAWFWLPLAAVAVLFVWLKSYVIAGFLPHFAFVYTTVGLSYILFRIVHLMIDVHQGVQALPSALDYWNYVPFFLSFTSGPIQRYQEFAPQIDAGDEAVQTTEIHNAIDRVLMGLLVSLIVAPFLLEYVDRWEGRALASLQGAGLPHAVIALSTGALLYLIYLYINFAAYMNIVIGIGRLAGISLPENFNHPERSRSFLDLWSRWHITLSDWFKFYLFNPLLKLLAERWGTPARMPYLGVVAYFVTFAVMGIWHGSTFVFLFYGLFLGLGAAVNKLFEVQMPKITSKSRYKELRRKFWYTHLARGGTIAYFAIAVCCLWVTPDKAHLFATRFGLAASTLSLAFLTVLIATGSGVVTFYGGMADRFMTQLSRYSPAPKWPGAWTATKLVMFVMLVMIWGQSAPEFVYKAF